MPKTITNEDLIVVYKEAKAKGDEERAAAAFEAIYDGMERAIAALVCRGCMEHSFTTDEDKKDLSSVAKLALMKSIENYDVNKGAKFFTYAYATIRGDIARWFYDRSMLKMTDELKAQCSKYMRTMAEYQTCGDRQIPADDYIRQRMDVGEKTYLYIKEAVNSYYVESIYDECNKDLVVSDVEKPQLSDEDKKRLVLLIMGLKDRNERQVIIDHFYNGLDYVEIAAMRGVSKQRISAIKKSALLHLSENKEIQELATEMGIK